MQTNIQRDRNKENRIDIVCVCLINERVEKFVKFQKLIYVSYAVIVRTNLNELNRLLSVCSVHAVHKTHEHPLHLSLQDHLKLHIPLVIIFV